MTRPRVYPAGMTYREYDALPGLRWSLLRYMRTSPRQFQWAEQHQAAVLAPTDDMVVGNAIHVGTLEPHRFDDEFCVYKERRNSNAWKAFREANVSRTILTSPMLTRAVTTTKAVQSDPVAREYLGRGVAEQVVTWTDLATGIACKARCDQVNGHLIDLKSTKVIEVQPFIRLGLKMGYPEQLAYYRAGLRANKIAVAPEAILIVAQTAPAWDVVVYEVDERVIDAAWLNVRGLLDALAECRESNVWPGMAPAPIAFDPPERWYGERITLKIDGVELKVSDL